MTENSYNSFVNLEMSPTMLVGHSVIDDDHLLLIKIINKINDSLRDADREGCLSLLNDFADLMANHFQREEDILRKAEFPRFEEHCNTHADLLKKFNALVQDFQKQGECEQVRKTLCSSLTSFLIDEAIRSDMDFKSHLMEQYICGPLS